MLGNSGFIDLLEVFALTLSAFSRYNQKFELRQLVVIIRVIEISTVRVT